MEIPSTVITDIIPKKKMRKHSTGKHTTIRSISIEEPIEMKLITPTKVIKPLIHQQEELRDLSDFI